MDLVTHALTGTALSLHDKEDRLLFKLAVVAGSLLPDTGEILIQRALAEKYGEALAVYDERTSDPLIASDLSVTWLYDLLHSPFLVVVLFLVGTVLVRSNKLSGLKLFGQLSQRLSVGLLSQVVLDSFTHGKIWAMKLLFPFSQHRFEILADSVGNWWEWSPQFSIAGFGIPNICAVIWVILLGYIVYQVKARSPESK